MLSVYHVCPSNLQCRSSCGLEDVHDTIANREICRLFDANTQPPNMAERVQRLTLFKVPDAANQQKLVQGYEAMKRRQAEVSGAMQMFHRCDQRANSFSPRPASP